MGNDLGKGANRMAIAAMANVTNLDKKELLSLHKKFQEIAERDGNPNTLSRHDFRDALEEVGIVESDKEIVERLFTMLDKTGDEQINFREFVVGIAPLISGDVQDKLHFAFDLYDRDGSGEIKAAEMSFILSSMNNVASYFGDPVMSQDQVEQLVEDIYKTHDTSGTNSLNYAEFIVAIAEHPLLVQFINGKGTVRYGTGK